jgi:hypothetical protein
MAHAVGEQIREEITEEVKIIDKIRFKKYVAEV